MNPPARWRRDAFDPRYAHLPDPDYPAVRTRRGRVRFSLCGRYVRPDEPAERDALLCPDCDKLDDHPDGGTSSGTAPAAGGG